MKSGGLFVLVALLALESQLTGALTPVKGGGLSRPGACPFLPPGTKGLCVQACNGDDSCPPGKKCCGNGCGQVCMAAVKERTVRPGSCPIPKEGSVGICVEACQGDESCPQGQKCCSNGCGHICMTPVKARSLNICEQPMDKGLCMAYMPMFYYNSKTKKCESFIYGGCQGNENRFKTKEECMARCGGKHQV
ncbi:WAP four-disulfide core domain protein 3-like [Tachyglossus aculeatus]|uniref:WAP four-disulfide core domain protein 3-like n=1 Tax=Tachyglossus aculeatus TaxID=9261 RepID=UPI0018F4F0A4|nr:WAP four-disulfide core domain protein 3-like [Tachyglossus aculeatus]